MAADGEDQRKTYTIWGFAILFIAMIAVGTYAVVAYGTHDREPTEEVSSDQKAGPDPTTPPSESTEVTMLDGNPAPEGVSEVLEVGDGQWSYLFEIPDALLEAPTSSVVAESDLVVSEDRQSITVTMFCAVSNDSVPALLEVSEDPFEINVRPIVIGASFGLACEPEAELVTVTVPLEEAVGGRRVVLAQAGNSVALGEIG